MTDPIRLDIEGALAIITLARPEKLNALDEAMMTGLAAAADRIDADGNLRAAILTGEGKGFCAGGDIGAWGSLSPLAITAVANSALCQPYR